MTLIGYRSANHPQQVATRGPRKNVDDRAITPEDFAPLHERFQFTIDAAASIENARLPRYWTEDDDALSQSWAGERVWCNPPYSHPNLERWVAKAWSEWRSHDRPALIVMLVPANRTEQKWWQEWIEPNRDRWHWDDIEVNMMRVEFLPGRIRFLRHGATEIKPNERPPFGCCLLIWTTP
jgi:phage N-6-adenine-methyltransferase